MRLGLFVFLTLLPGWAMAFRAINWHHVNPVSGDIFEVISRPGSGAQDYWCAAGDYARRVLDTKAVQRIYIWKAPGPSVTEPGRTAVQFSLSPPPGPAVDPGYSLSVKAVGDSLTSAAAHQYCYGEDPFDPFLLRGF